MKSVRIITFSFVAIFAACKGGESPAKLKGNLALALQSGGSVSSSSADDLYPQIVTQSNGFITLFFVSNRTSANACSGIYCIYVSQSVSTYTDGSTALPAFSDPVALNVNSTLITGASPIGFVAFYDAALPGYRIVYSENGTYPKLALLPQANVLTGTLSGYPQTEVTSTFAARVGLINGADATSASYYIMGDGGATQKKIQLTTASDSGTNICTVANNCRWVTYVKSGTALGVDFLHISTDGKLYKSAGGVSRAAAGFNQTLSISKLKLTGLSSLGHGKSDLLIASASDATGLSDLYVLDSPLKEALTSTGDAPPAGSIGSIAGTSTISTTATRVYGSVDFTTIGGGTTTQTTFTAPFGISTDSTGVYVADQTSTRALFFPGTSTTASRVYGQTLYTTTGTGLSTTAFGTNNVPGVSTSGSGVFVSDILSHRVLYFDGTSTTASRVYGQGATGTSFGTNASGTTNSTINNPDGVTADGNNGVYIADASNNRVLYFSGTSVTASRVYGQLGSFVTGTSNNGGIGPNSLSGPRSIAIATDGIYIVDTGNTRVLFYPGTSTTASRVYGQPNFTTAGTGTTATTFQTLVWSVATYGNDVFIFDGNNNRVLAYSGTSTTPYQVYGQPSLNFTAGTANNGGRSASSLNSAGTYGHLTVDASGLYVTDNGNKRVLFFPRQ